MAKTAWKRFWRTLASDNTYSSWRSHLYSSVDYQIHFDLMDRGPIMDLANRLIRLDMFPYFELVHGLLTSLYIRSEVGPSNRFSRRHPFSCWLSTMLSIYAGALLVNFFLSEPLVNVFRSTNSILLFTAAWYAVFYSPFDIVYKICTLSPCLIIMEAVREVLRVKVISTTVNHTGRLYPGNYLIIIALGTISASGGGWLKSLERLLRGIWTPNAIEALYPSYYSKTALLASTIFTITKQTNLVQVPPALIYFAVVSLLVYLKLSASLLGFDEPFRWIENFASHILFGTPSEPHGAVSTKAKKVETEKLTKGGDKVKRADAKKTE